MNGTRFFDERIKRCVRKATTDIRLTLQKLQSELSICNKYAFKVIKSDSEKKSMLKGILESAKQIGKDTRHVIHICTSEEQGQPNDNPTFLYIKERKNERKRIQGGKNVQRS